MTRSKAKRLRIIPSHLPLIRDKLADYAQYRLGELGTQTQYEAMMANAWSMTDQIRTAQLWWVSRDMTRLAEDTVQAGDFPKPDPPTQCGMVFFDGDVQHISFHLDDDGFGETRIAAILWQDVGHESIKISVFTDNPVGIREMHADLFGLPVVGLAPSVVREGDGSFQWVCGLLYAVWALSGARVGETLGLDVEDCHLDDGRPWVRFDRKGDWSQRVAIPSEASEALARLVGGRRRGAVFREDSGARLRQQTAVGIVSSVALRIGVPSISPHSLRRTFCTLSRDAGVPDRDIMAAAGWNSPKMLDYYDMSRRGLNGKAGDGLQDYLGKED